MSFFFNHSGKIHKEATPVLMSDNRAFRYGDGLFETMRISKGKIIRAKLHFERLFNSLAILRYQVAAHFTPGFLKKEILELAQLNKHHESGKIRLTIYRGNGNLYHKEDQMSGYVIETCAIEPSAGEWNPHGLVTDIYPDARRACDRFSSLKSSNFLCYSMAADFAEENKLNDVILLNSHGRICDSTIANVFIVSGKEIITPPLSEGCIAGTFRKFLLRELPSIGFSVSEQPITIDDLKDADEIFLTNAIQQIRWVVQHDGKQYPFEESFKIYTLLQPTI